MEALWNQINLQRPPYRSWDVPVNEYNSRKFIDAVDKILNDFKSFEILHKEAALLSRLIYRMKSKFRSDKGLKHMEKVNRALLNYLNMLMEREYELLKEYVEISNGIVSLPPRQTLEYVLVRTQGFAKLMCRVEQTAFIAGNILKSRLYIGQSWSVALIAYGVISRIWMISRLIIKKSCDWYSSIYKFLKTFKTVGISWLPDNYILPDDLSVWLNLPWFNENIESFPLQNECKTSIFSLIGNTLEEDSLDTTDDLSTNFKNDVESIYKKKTELIVKKEVNDDDNDDDDNDGHDDDFGKPISRLEFEEESKKANVEKSKIKNTKKMKNKRKLENNNEEKAEESKKAKVEKSEIKNTKKMKNKRKLENNNSDKKTKLFIIKSQKHLVRLLKSDSYPGFDKLEWNILRKRLTKKLLKLTKNNTCDVNDEMIKKINKYFTKWINS